MRFEKFFSHIQETSWYRQFLDPVVQEVEAGSTILDIGTGSGKLLEILAKERHVKCVGVDTNAAMLEEARKKVAGTNAELHLIEANTQLPFESGIFEHVIICNLLFILPQDAVDFLLKEAFRLLKKGGNLIVLSPSGKGNFFELSRHFFSLHNLSIYVWFYATRRRGRLWREHEYLFKYARRHHLSYRQSFGLAGLAQIEILKEA